MKCPFTFPLVRYGQAEGDFVKGNCIKEECAWWSNNSQQCYLGVLTGEIYSLVEVMEEIRDKLTDLAKIGGLRG